MVSIWKWIKSSFSGGNDGGDCVKVRLLVADEMIIVKDEQNDTVLYNRQEWEAFVKGVKAGEFDWDVLLAQAVADAAKF
jgi:Domain of unknown function (DUF397)